MSKYQLRFTRQAQKDVKKVASSGLKPKIMKLLKLFEHEPFSEYFPFEKLIGDLDAAYSRSINIQDRIIYQVLEDEKIVKVIRMSPHYE